MSEAVSGGKPLQEGCEDSLLSWHGYVLHGNVLHFVRCDMTTVSSNQIIIIIFIIIIIVLEI